MTAPPNIEKAPVSVIIPCFRRSETIKRAVDSVVGQTLPPKEIILVDDFSNDENKTLNILSTIQKTYLDSNIHIIKLKHNGGAAQARNAGWDAAEQPLIAFLDSDDIWHPKKLEIQIPLMINHPEVSICGHKIEVIDQDFKVSPVTTPVARKINKWSWLFSCQFSTISVVMKKNLPLRFDPAKRLSEDYLLWLTIALTNHEIWSIEVP